VKREAATPTIRATVTESLNANVQVGFEKEFLYEDATKLIIQKYSG
jgi:hypothetical protein